VGRNEEQDGKMIKNTEILRIWELVAVACFKILSQHSCGETKERMKNHSQDGWSAGQDSNISLEYYNCTSLLSLPTTVLFLLYKGFSHNGIFIMISSYVKNLSHDSD
jgi:hypothetical protein